MPIPQSLTLLLSDLPSILLVQEGVSLDPSAGMKAFWLVGAIAAFLVLTLGFQFLNHRRKLQEMKLKTLESLARQGKIGREDIERAFGDADSLPKGIVVVAWITFLVSTMLAVLSQIDLRWREGFLPSILVAVLSFGVLSAPFLLKELRGQARN